MTRLVNGQSTGMIPVPVPTLEITRAMVRIDVPIQIDGCNPSELSGEDSLLDLGVIRAVPVIKSDRDAPYEDL